MKDIKLLESVQRWATKVLKVLEHKILQEQLRSLGLAQPRAEELRGGLTAAAAPHMEWRGSAELCSL